MEIAVYARANKNEIPRFTIIELWHIGEAKTKIRKVQQL